MGKRDQALDDYTGGDGLRQVDFIMRSEHNRILAGAQARADRAEMRAKTDREEALTLGMVIGGTAGLFMGMLLSAFVIAGVMAA